MLSGMPTVVIPNQKMTLEFFTSIVLIKNLCYNININKKEKNI